MDYYSQLNVKELKNVLKAKKLPVSGKKSDLISRLIASTTLVTPLNDGNPAKRNKADMVNEEEGEDGVPQSLFCNEELNDNVATGKKRKKVSLLLSNEENDIKKKVVALESLECSNCEKKSHLKCICCHKIICESCKTSSNKKYVEYCDSCIMSLSKGQEGRLAKC